MPTAFTLELYYEGEIDRVFANDAAERLQRLLRALAPHIELTIQILQAKGNGPWKIPRWSAERM